MTKKPSESEEEYFARLELERRKDMAAKAAAAMAESERNKLREQHWMRCPKDGQELGTIKLRGVTIDTCATCGGTWLDAGELDQLTDTADTGPLGALRKIFKGD
jgi:hypothetical protein